MLIYSLTVYPTIQSLDLPMDMFDSSSCKPMYVTLILYKTPRKSELDKYFKKQWPVCWINHAAANDETLHNIGKCIM